MARARLTSLVFVGACIVAAATGAGVYVGSSANVTDDTARRVDAARLMNELMSGKVGVGGPFTLSDETGRRVRLADFAAKVVVLYFGYTFCPDVCPTDLQAIATMLDDLGPSRTKVQPVFITLDPERDTPDQLAKYVKSFSPQFVTLRGSESETRAVARAYRVFYEKVQQPQSQYVIDHTAFTFVVDQHGNYAGFFPPGTAPDRMAAVVRDVIRSE